jgi:phosphoribosylglycinamide formyltransferase-1
VKVKRIVILASGSGSNAQALIDATRDGGLDAEVAAIVSDRPDAGVLQRAAQAGIPTVCLPLAARRDTRAREAYTAQLGDVVAAFHPDVVVCAGWMLILAPAFAERFVGRAVNVHPALLPDDDSARVSTSVGEIPVLRGARAVRDALRVGLPVTGATVHYVTAEVDAGPVIAREEVPILAGDDEARLHERIKAVEHRLLVEAVASVLDTMRGEEGE